MNPGRAPVRPSPINRGDAADLLAAALDSCFGSPEVGPAIVNVAKPGVEITFANGLGREGRLKQVGPANESASGCGDQLGRLSIHRLPLVSDRHGFVRYGTERGDKPISVAVSHCRPNVAIGEALVQFSELGNCFTRISAAATARRDEREQGQWVDGSQVGLPSLSLRGGAGRVWPHAAEADGQHTTWNSPFASL